MTTNFAEIRDFVIENGRVLDNGEGLFDFDSLAAEIKYECGEREMSAEDTTACIMWASANTKCFRSN